jgi:hypothetical protein
MQIQRLINASALLTKDPLPRLIIIMRLEGGLEGRVTASLSSFTISGDVALQLLANALILYTSQARLPVCLDFRKAGFSLCVTVSNSLVASGGISER